MLSRRTYTMLFSRKDKALVLQCEVGCVSRTHLGRTIVHHRGRHTWFEGQPDADCVGLLTNPCAALVEIANVGSLWF